MKQGKPLIVAVAIAVLYACGGGGSSSSSPTAPSTTPTSPPPSSGIPTMTFSPRTVTLRVGQTSTVSATVSNGSKQFRDMYPKECWELSQFGTLMPPICSKNYADIRHLAEGVFEIRAVSAFKSPQEYVRISVFAITGTPYQVGDNVQVFVNP